MCANSVRQFPVILEGPFVTAARHHRRFASVFLRRFAGFSSRAAVGHFLARAAPEPGSIH
jgi:hypothetical protein